MPLRWGRGGIADTCSEEDDGIGDSEGGIVRVFDGHAVPGAALKVWHSILYSRVR